MEKTLELKGRNATLDAMARMERAMIRLAEAFRPTINAFRKAAASIAKLHYSIAKHFYLKCVGPLPGSERTARLRKKRHKMVLEWFGGFIDRETNYG